MAETRKRLEPLPPAWTEETDQRRDGPVKGRGGGGGRKRWGRYLFGVLAVALLVAGGLWAALYSGVVGNKPETVPTVYAPEGPAKVKPETPGGMEVPNQDKLVYNRVGDNGASTKVERLLPAPEAPMPAPKMPSMEKAEAAIPTAPTVKAMPAAPVESAPLSLKPMPAAPVESAPPPPAAPRMATTTVTGGGKLESVMPPAVPAAPPSVVEKPAPAPSMAKAPAAPVESKPAPAPAAAPLTSDTYLVQVAAFRDEATAEKGWKALQTKYKDLLGGLRPDYQRVDLGAKGIFFRVRGGPLASEQAARDLCDKLKAAKGSCIVVKP